MKLEKNKIMVKTMYVLLIFAMIVGQSGLVPVIAETVSGTEAAVKISVDKKDVKINEEVAVAIEGTASQLDNSNLVTDPTFVYQTEKSIDETHKEVRYIATKAGNYLIYNESNGLKSNELSINVAAEAETPELAIVDPEISEKNDEAEDVIEKQDASSKYSVNLEGPKSGVADFATTAGYVGFSYTVTINSDANTANIVSGIELTFTPPAGYVVDSIPTDGNSSVESYTINADGTVLIILKPLTQGIEDFSISVKPVTAANAENNVNDRFEGENLHGEITGNPTANGEVPSDSADTTLVGSTKYVVTKEAKVSPGSTNRLVTYVFNVNREGSIHQITLQDLTLTDNIPAGAIIRNTVDAGGKWTITGDQSSGWETIWYRDKQFIGAGNTLATQDGSQPQLIVEYPEDKFPDGTKPPVNTVELSGHDNNTAENNGDGVIWDGRPGSTQGPELSSGDGDSSGVDKKIPSKNWLSGSIYTNYEVDGSFIANEGSDTRVTELVLEDNQNKHDNELFWHHFLLSTVSVKLNSSIVASKANYALEYQTNQNTWREAFSQVAKEKIVVGFHVKGSINYVNQDKLDLSIELAPNEIMTGWRIVVKEDKSIGTNAQVQVEVNGVPSYANLYDKTTTDDVSQVTNTASQIMTYADGNVSEEKTSSATTSIKPNLNLNTVITAPSSLETGTKNNYVMSTSNATPEQDVDGVIIRVVLPAGITLDINKGVTAVADMLGEPYNIPTPQPGKDVEITTETLLSSEDYTESRQIVVFKFKNDLVSLRSAESASDRWVERSGFSYNIPVEVSQTAYDAFLENGNKAPVESWITTNSENYADYSVSAYKTSNHADTHNFDEERESIVWDNESSQIISKGGLFLSKTVESMPESGFYNDVEVLFGETATWKLTLSNTLVTVAKKPVIFDELSKINGNSDFVTTLSGPVIVPVNGVVEYSKNATSAKNGDWSSEWQGGKAIRVTLPDLKQNSKEEISIPVRVPDTTNQGDLTINTATGTANLNNNDLGVTSNSAQINVIVPLGEVVLTKTDATTGEVLQGAVFELQDGTGKVLESSLTTDASGKLAIDDLAPGSYQLVETQAPTGYELDETPLVFEIVKGQTTAVAVKMTNKLTPGSVVLEKIDDKSGKTIAGAKFKLQTKDGQVLIENMETDDSGRIAIMDLEPGNYQLIETTAPDGYELDATPIDFTVEKNQETPVTVKKTNQGKMRTVRVEKTDAKTNVLLAGAVFDVLSSEGQVIKKNLETDSSGTFEINDLEIGAYQLVETKAPKGYELDSKPIDFTIEDDDQLITINKYNYAKTLSVPPKKPSNHLPQTGEKTASNLMFIGWGMVTIIAYIYVSRRKEATL